MSVDKPPSCSQSRLEALRGVLDDGGVVIGPTESSYAVIARIDRPEAMAKVMALKGRPSDKGVPVVVGTFDLLDAWVDWPAALLPYAALWPAALSLVVPCRQSLPPGVLAPDGTLAARLTPRADLAALASRVGVPLCVTSANRSGEAPALRVEELPAAWLTDTDVWDVGPLPGGPPSTLVALDPQQKPRVVRQGSVPASLLAGLGAPLGPISEDSLWQGSLRLAQPRRGEGYRFNLDPILLAGFVREALNKVEDVVELGAGCGVLSLWLVAAGVAQRSSAVERQPELAKILARNIVANRQVGRTTAWPGDLRAFATQTAVELVVFNPPYYPSMSGRPSHTEGRDQARRELFGTLKDFVDCASRVLKPGGRLAAIVPAHRRQSLAEHLLDASFVVERWQPVSGRAGDSPGRVLVMARLSQGQFGNGSDIVERQPWVIHQGQGRALALPFDRWVSGPEP